MFDILSDIYTISMALLAIVGGLKIIARYTKTRIDDKILEIIEKVLKFIVGSGKWKSKKK